MCLNSYKGVIRGAFALTVSFLEVATFTPNTRDELKVMVTTYLKDNHIGFNFDAPENRGIVTKIVRAGESVYFDKKSMDEALARLSKGISLDLTNKEER